MIRALGGFAIGVAVGIAIARGVGMCGGFLW